MLEASELGILIFPIIFLGLGLLIYIALKTFDHPFASAKTNVLSWVFFGSALFLLPFPVELSGGWMLGYILFIAYMSMKVGRWIGREAGWEPEPEPATG